jgi:16S rRNA (adenine1518-N6/adenine1519-N6)-dimethyltransferase
MTELSGDNTMHLHTPRKRFGQHFLHDKQIIQSIINALAPKPEDHIVEIGPGQGALTVPLLKTIGKLAAIELDRDLIPALTARCKEKGTLIVYEADALEFDFLKLIQAGESLRIVGNLPYNISTPLVFHLLKFAKYITDMHFMLQKEVVSRLAATPHSEDYGRLSIMVQYHCQVTALFNVSRHAFYPPPQVESSVVRLVPYHVLPHPAEDYQHFANVVKLAFAHRRKTLRNCLKELVNDHDWEQLNIDSQKRPEELGVSEYVKISNYLVNLS